MTHRRLAGVVYALAVRAFPPAHRAKYADEMIDAFGRALTAQRIAHGRLRALGFTAAAVLDAVSAGFGERRRHNHGGVMHLGMSWLDVKLGVRMLFKYKGLTLAGGLALAIAIGTGAAWYDFLRDQFNPRLPLPGGDRLIELELRNAASSQVEFRVLHDFLNWRRDARSIEELGAYRSLERNLALGNTRAEPVSVAEITASAFRIVRVPPILGRPLLDEDERPGAPAVVVIGHSVWQRQFGGRADAIGQTLQVGRVTTTVVGVMPEGFAFPRSQKLWMPLRLRPSGYAPLEGPAVRLFGRLAPRAEEAEALAEVAAVTERVATTSPQTHQHLRPRVRPFGRDDLGAGGLVDFAATHLPILLVLIVACANVGTLVYARTATREAEIAVRHALGASRGRIAGQLFVEALVLAAAASVVGLFVADSGLRWMFMFVAANSDGVPFWIQPGLKLPTVFYAALLAVGAAALLGVLPAIKATGSGAQPQLKNLGAGGSTLRFGKVWTTVMIAQVAVTVICIPIAIEIAEETVRDRLIRVRFPAEQYLAVQLELDREAAPSGTGDESPAAFATRLERVYRELERHLGQETGVRAVTFGDRLPGMGASVRGAEIEVPGSSPRRVRHLWRASVGPGYFEAFDKPIVSGRGLHAGDRAAGAEGVVVNEAFARRLGANPVGQRLRYTSGESATPEPWLEIIGMVRDMGMTPTDFGEAPYVFHAATPSTARPLMMGVRTAGDPAALTTRVRERAAALDAGLRLHSVQPLDALVWTEDAPLLAVTAGIFVVVLLGLCMSAAGIFSLMAVTVARRTREIGLRAALGASQTRLLAGIFSRPILLVGGGIAAGNIVLVIVWFFGTDLIDSGRGPVTTSAVMLIVGILACVGPARRALRIQPTDALKEA